MLCLAGTVRSGCLSLPGFMLHPSAAHFIMSFFSCHFVTPHIFRLFLSFLRMPRAAMLFALLPSAHSACMPRAPARPALRHKQTVKS